MKKSNLNLATHSLVCVHCGKNLLDDIGMSMINIQTDCEDKIVSFKPCCKGKCDNIIKNQFEMYNDGWKELSDLVNPVGYLTYLMAVLNNQHEGKGFANDEAFNDFKQLMISLYPYVVRDMDESEQEKAMIISLFNM